jgi:zinc protease
MIVAGLCVSWCGAAWAAVEPGFHVPYEKYKLANGLKVILSRDAWAPVTAVYVYYDVGSRSEEKGHIGYAHLFEHLMLDGSANVKKGEHARYIKANGGESSGAAHPDYTSFYDVMPSNKLALALWLESDRMRGPVITDEILQSVKGAVREERRTLDGQAYRPALADKWPALLFSDFHNAHSVVGSGGDIDAATVEEATKFFRTHYAPNNAVLVISGDFVTAEARKLVEQYFADMAARPEPVRPSLSEPARAAGNTATVVDEHARVPAVVIGWPAPKRHSADWYALDVLDAVLTAGRTSRLEQELMNGRQSALQIEANLGWPWSSPAEFRDPGHYAVMIIHKPNYATQDLVEQYQQVIDAIAGSGIDPNALPRAKVMMRLEQASGRQTALERGRLLGLFETIDGDAGAVDRDAAGVQAVTAEQIQAAAKKYLPAARRDVLIIRTPDATGAKR